MRDLPDGGRIFTLADGVMVRVGLDGRLTAIGMDGSVTLLEPARGGVVTLPDGRELMLKPEAVRVTHEAAGIEGLPLDIDPTQTAQGRCRVELPGGLPAGCIPARARGHDRQPRGHLGGARHFPDRRRG
ncbi:MAG: hypothetical protein MZV70_52195 [Desulfobacterales bacterium]|nr:hypothetical protein [Desulfobacterales bacterium]